MFCLKHFKYLWTLLKTACSCPRIYLKMTLKKAFEDYLWSIFWNVCILQQSMIDGCLILWLPNPYFSHRLRSMRGNGEDSQCTLTCVLGCPLEPPGAERRAEIVSPSVPPPFPGWKAPLLHAFAAIYWKHWWRLHVCVTSWSTPDWNRIWSTSNGCLSMPLKTQNAEDSF